MTELVIPDDEYCTSREYCEGEGGYGTAGVQCIQLNSTINTVAPTLTRPT